jgi:hypothetical protein
VRKIELEKIAFRFAGLKAQRAARQRRPLECAPDAARSAPMIGTIDGAPDTDPGAPPACISVSTRFRPYRKRKGTNTIAVP